MKTINEAAKDHSNEYWGENYNTECKNYNEAGFKSGVEFAQLWIPVEEELPENGVHVIFKIDGFLPSIGFFSEKECGFKITGLSGYYKATHWRPIELK